MPRRKRRMENSLRLHVAIATPYGHEDHSSAFSRIF